MHHTMGPRRRGARRTDAGAAGAQGRHGAGGRSEACGAHVRQRVVRRESGDALARSVAGRAREGPPGPPRRLAGPRAGQGGVAVRGGPRPVDPELDPGRARAAEAKAAAATRCTHVVDGHAFTVRDQTGVTEPRDRGQPLHARPSRGARSSGGLHPVWTARLTDPARRHLGVTTVNLSPKEAEAFEQVCRWIVTGDLARSLRTPTYSG